MLTPGLEEAIQKGYATYKTFVLGGSGVGTIPIPNDRFLVITDFDFHYFCDFPEGMASLEELILFVQSRSVFQLEFRSTKSQNHFGIRNKLALTVVGEAIVSIPQGHYHKDCYLVHQENVAVNILNVPDTSLWTTVYSPLPAKSQENPQPVGYGIAGQPAVRKIDFNPALSQIVLPLTQYRDDIAPGATYREQFRVNVNADNKLNDVFKDAFFEVGNYSYPLVNVGYVEFSKRPNWFVKGSN